VNNFTPDDWIKIGSSLIASYFGCRGIFLFLSSMFGLEPSPHQIEVSVSGTVQHVDGDAE
jgi:hypothetical protein